MVTSKDGNTTPAAPPRCRSGTVVETRRPKPRPHGSSFRTGISRLPGQPPPCLVVLRPLAVQAPDRADILFLIGLAAIEASQNPGIAQAGRDRLLDEAIAALRAMLIERPELVRARLELARAFFDAADLGLAVKLPPRRTIAYFKAKGYTVSWNWWDAWGEAHAKAFTAAKAVKLDVLQSLRGGLDRALAQGLTERTFIKTMEPALRRLGWWGRQFVVNARGEAESVQLGSPHRLKTIFRTNTNTSYAAARERQQRADAGNRPYWQYLSMADGLTRPSHAALNGQVFRPGLPPPCRLGHRWCCPPRSKI